MGEESGAAELTLTVDSPTHPITTVREVARASVRQRVSIPLTPPTDTAGITVELAGNIQHDGVKFRRIQPGAPICKIVFFKSTPVIRLGFLS